MDGGGRYLEPLTAFPAGVAVARAPHPPSFPSRRPNPLLFRLPRFKRRRSVSVPLARRLPRFLGSSLAVAYFAGILAVGLSEGGHLDEVYRRYGEPHHALGRLVGLGLEKVTISGIAQMRESEVLAAAGLSDRLSLVFLSAGEVRERLEKVPLIKTAAVRKLYPHELVVTLTERKPYGLWQLNGELFVIAADGTVIDRMHDDRFADLPLVVGEQANTRTKEYLALVEAAGPLKNRIRAGTLVGPALDAQDRQRPRRAPARARRERCDGPPRQARTGPAHPREGRARRRSAHVRPDRRPPHRGGGRRAGGSPQEEAGPRQGS